MKRKLYFNLWRSLVCACARVCVCIGVAGSLCAFSLFFALIPSFSMRSAFVRSGACKNSNKVATAWSQQILGSRNKDLEHIAVSYTLNWNWISLFPLCHHWVSEYVIWTIKLFFSFLFFYISVLSCSLSFFRSHFNSLFAHLLCFRLCCFLAFAFHTHSHILFGLRIERRAIMVCMFIFAMKEASGHR